jgi:hypothetical protein
LPVIPRLIWIIALSGVILAALILFDIVPSLRGEFGWRWPYELAVGRVVPLILGVVVCVGGGYILLRRTSRPLLFLLWSMAGVVVLSLLVVNLRSDNVLGEMFARTASILTTGVHYAGTQIVPDSPVWGDWITAIQQNPNFGAHVVNGPPGLPLFYSLLSGGLDSAPGIASPLFRTLLPLQCQNYNLLSYTPGQWASAWFGILMPVWAALGVLPLYAVARRLSGTSPVAREIALWYPLIPALSMFAATWYTFYPVWMLVVFWLLATGIANRQPLRVVLAGVVMGISLFMAYALVPVIGFLGMYTLAYYWWVERPAGKPWFRPLVTGLWFGLGLILPWIVYWLLSGDTFFALLAASFNFHLELERSYLPWIFLHFWDWVLFNGFVLMLAWLAGLWLWKRRGENVPLVGLALLVAMIVLCVSGTARGETGRVWLAFTPFALLAAGEMLSQFNERTRYISSLQTTEGDKKSTWLVLAVGQGILLVALAMALPVIATDFTPPPPAPELAQGLQATDAIFSAANEGGRFRLTGWHATGADGEITLNLAWEDMAQNIHPYYFGAVLVAPEGQTFDAGVWQPGQGVPVAANSPDAPRGVFPTTCWMPGMQVGDTITLGLPPDAVSGDWWISLAAFGDPMVADGRLLVTATDGSQDGQVGLGPIPVE